VDAIARALIVRWARGMTAPQASRITYVGHATILVEAGGTRVLTDPVLRSRLGHLRRIVPVGPLPRLGPTDLVLISHAHRDHLDLPSLRRLAPAVPIVVPRGQARLARRAGFEDVREVEVGELVTIGALEVLATPAEHDGRRWPLGSSAPALGYVIQGGGRTYFAGDTDLFEGMGELGSGLDLALLPVAGWGPSTARARKAAATPLVTPEAATAAGTGAPSGSAPTTTTTLEQIERLVALHDSGNLNDNEFAAAKSRIVNGG
jgi:L-ascorbate metabolism protein UlaG (beta-lactamase superfamily)